MIEHTHKERKAAKWLMGTAQFTSHDVLQTLAHCVFNTCGTCGELFHATRINVYLGYNGKASIGDKDRPNGVEFRSADSFAVLRSYYKDKKSKPKAKCTFNVASIKVAESFKFLDPLRFEATPVSGTKEELCVVGYPSDMAYRSEKGAQMYVHFKKDQSWDLSKSRYRMLTYTISTLSGKSGT